jgi:hypothetical protein
MIKAKNHQAMIKAKPYLIGAAAAGGAFILWRLFRGKRTERAERLPVTGRPTKPENWYTVKADALELAMFDAGTDEAIIYSTFQDLENNADFDSLFNAFGVRTYTGDWLPTPWMSGNLVQWLNYELDESERERVNEIMAGNGLTMSI